MDDFNLEPAKDLGLSHRERTLSVHRESDLIETCSHAAYWALMRTYFKIYHRLKITGLDHVPNNPPFVMVANHTSHLDALTMAAPLPWRHRDRVFPLAAGDVFFETPVIATFAMSCINALPLWRHNCGRHALSELRKRLVDEPCIYILFPEGTRSADGKLGPFKAGLGMLIAETGVPLIPCHIQGGRAAWPRDRKIPRPGKLRLRIGKPLDFDSQPNRRAGWAQIAERSHAAVAALAK